MEAKRNVSDIVRESFRKEPGIPVKRSYVLSIPLFHQRSQNVDGGRYANSHLIDIKKRKGIHHFCTA